MTPHPNRSKKKNRTATTTSRPSPVPRRAATVRHLHDEDYSGLLSGVTNSFILFSSAPHLFCTDADGLYDLYLKNIPARFRQHHTCSACRRFIENYGGLVTIGKDGEHAPAMWNREFASEFYEPAFQAMHDRVKRAKVTSVFLTKEKTWGLPETGVWKHMAVRPPAHLVYSGLALTAGQAMAAAIENVKTVSTALGEFTPAMLDQALRLLEGERLAQSEKFIGPVRWLRRLHDRPKGRLGQNLLWAAVAAAPEGYCHPRASVVGSLLEDIAAGMGFADIKKRFDAKMHPLLYQRPQAAPSEGNIKAAEDLVARLGIEASLSRRFARLDELETIWTPHSRPRVPHPPIAGVFDHLRAESPAGLDLPQIRVTWEKFARVVLPDTEKIEVRLGDRASLLAFTTAQNPDAPLLFKWDNPVAWYLYHGGSAPSDWGVSARSWLRVTAIAPLPTMWGARPQPHLGEGVVLVIANCVDRRSNQGNALFPANLRGDLHGVRSTIEAYSKRAVIGGRESASACGLDIRKGSNETAAVRVLASGGWAEYAIDRWD